MITHEFLREVHIFKGLTDEQAGRILNLAKLETFKKGETIFRERDPGKKVYAVVSGVVEVGRSGRTDGKFLRLARLERGELLGELVLFEEAPRSATAVAVLVPETRLAAWEIAALRAMLEQDPVLANRVLRSLTVKLAQRLRATSDAMLALLRMMDYGT